MSNLSRIISRPYIYRKILKDGLCFDQIKKMKYIYVPLHLEPEMALQNFSPEFKSLIGEYNKRIILSLPKKYGNLMPINLAKNLNIIRKNFN